MNNINTSHLPSVDVAAERFARRVTARLTEGTSSLPYDISERLRASRMQALAKRKVTVPVRRTAPAAVVVNAGSTATLGRGGEGGGWWNALVSAVPLLALVVGHVGMVLVHHAKGERHILHRMRPGRTSHH